MDRSPWTEEETSHQYIIRNGFRCSRQVPAYCASDEYTHQLREKLAIKDAGWRYARLVCGKADVDLKKGAADRKKHPSVPPPPLSTSHWGRKKKTWEKDSRRYLLFRIQDAIWQWTKMPRFGQPLALKVRRGWTRWRQLGNSRKRRKIE